MSNKLISFAVCTALIFVGLTVCFSGSYSVEAASGSYTPYYYSRLSGNARKVYDELKRAAVNCNDTVRISTQISKDDFDKITELLIYHDPVTFNIKKIKAGMSAGYMVFEITYRYDKDTYDMMTAEYEKAADEILDGITDDMPVYRKIKAIHDGIIDRAVYTLKSDANDTVYGTLVEKKGKCDGYSKTFAYICSKAGINAVCVIGEYKDDEYHMWNKVYYNKKWYNVDVTWDDPVGSLRNNKKYDYFMLSDKAMGKTHKESSICFDAPAADDDTKDYFVVNKKYAEDKESAKKLLKKSLVSAAKNGETKAVIKCSSKEVYNDMKKYVMSKEKLSPVLKSVRNKNNDKLLSDVYSYGFNGDYYIITVYLFYDGTELDDYFSSTKKTDKALLKDLNKCGIK